jgi:hypothetical protein
MGWMESDNYLSHMIELEKKIIEIRGTCFECLPLIFNRPELIRL